MWPEGGELVTVDQCLLRTRVQKNFPETFVVMDSVDRLRALVARLGLGEEESLLGFKGWK